MVMGGHIAWGSWVIITIVTPYCISYTPMLTFLIKRESFFVNEKHQSNFNNKKLIIKKCIKLLFGTLYLTPLSIFYLFFIDFLYSLIGIFGFVISFII